ncbi:MAG TPA: M14 family zinc carboxypeptidase, partial [Fimbriimonadaceae bacterium]|nr:M14 family zinc carboxypeptidase [Fimbriimonadaceae bacterium]
MYRGPLCFALLSLALITAAQNDEAYSKKIREYTTEPFFLTDLVDHLPASKTVPTPEKFLGYVIGTPNVLTYASKGAEYLRALEKVSRRIRVMTLGKSEEGREMVVAFVSDESNLRKLDRIKKINGLLGDPRKIESEKEADALIKESVPMYWATGSMHATETGPPEMLLELAYRLIVSDDPMIQTIRKKSIIMITPVLDVDGRERVVDLYRYRKANPDKPEIPTIYWGKYVAHDDNRDGMTLSLALSKALTKTWLEYKPLVFHDLHESVPYLYISTGTGPYNPWYDPILIDEWHILAYNEVNDLTKRGVPGVWSHGFYDGWAASYGFTVANGHNGIGRFYETFSGGGADTGIRSAGSAASRDWYRPNPPFPRVRWSIRNNINIMQSALLDGFFKIANEKDTFMRNFYLKSKRSVAKARTEGPAAYVFPSSDPKKENQAKLAEILLNQGVEVRQLSSEVTTADGKFPAGSLVIRMDQPYSRLADMLLDKQYYKPTDPRSYDDCGWQFGPLFDIDVIRAKDVKVLDAPMKEYVPMGPADNRLANYLQTGSLPRIALVHTWQTTQDEGWFRKAFDELGVNYAYVSVHELRDTPNLRSKYEVILMPPARGDGPTVVNGRPLVGDPMPWKPSPEYPNLGGPDASDDIRGGIELDGVRNLKRFVDEGGMLICVGNMVQVPISYGLVTGVSVFQPKDLNAPGGVYLANNEAKDNPIMAGYKDTLSVYFNMNTLPILQIGGGGGFGGSGAGSGGRESGRGSLTDPDVVQGRPQYTPKEVKGDTPESRGANTPRLPSPKVLLRFAPADKLLVAGMISTPEELAGKPAVIQCPVGKGNILLISPNPMWRM